MALVGEQGSDLPQAVVFDGCTGWLHSAPGRTAILLISPWGYEALCMRRAWRMLADALAAAGYPTLRFDYRGTGDALGDAADIVSLEALKDSTRRAAAQRIGELGVTGVSPAIADAACTATGIRGCVTSRSPRGADVNRLPGDPA